MPRLKWNLGTAALAAVPALLFGDLPAAAQYYYPAPRVYAPAPPPPPAIGPQHAEAVVRSLGLTPLGRAIGQGPVFVVIAAGREGAEVQVTIDRHSGRVLRIVRADRPGPRIVSVPAAGAPAHDLDDEGPEDFASFGGRFPPPPPGNYRAEPDGMPPAGPSVVTRRGIEADDLPPPGQGPRVVVIERDITGSIPRNAAPSGADPLLGVPKEFRGQQARPAPQQQRTAARPPEAVRRAPMPRPRPADAPTVAQKETAPAPALKQEPHAAQQNPPAVTPVDPKSVPDVQGFE